MLINKVEEIEKTTTVHQQQIEELKVPEVVVEENDICTFKKHCFTEVMEVSFLLSIITLMFKYFSTFLSNIFLVNHFFNLNVCFRIFQIHFTSFNISLLIIL